MAIISWIRLLFVVFLPSCVSFGFSNPPNSQPNHLQNMIKIHPKHNVLHQAFLGFVTAWTIGTSVCVTSPLPCLAAESRLIGQIAGSGLLFKDTLNVESFDDPKVRCDLDHSPFHHKHPFTFWKILSRSEVLRSM